MTKTNSVICLILKRTTGVLCLFIFVCSLAWLYIHTLFPSPIKEFSTEKPVYVGTLWISEGTSIRYDNGKISRTSTHGTYSLRSPFVTGLGNILWIASSCASLLTGILLLKREAGVLATNSNNRIKSKRKVIAGGIGVGVLFVFFFMFNNLRFGAPSPSSVILDYGHITFNAPETMNSIDPSDIHLVFDLKTTVDDLKQRLEKAAEKKGEHIRVSDRMEALLSGSNFNIEAITSEVQDISRSNTTEWRWKVKSSNVGRHSLHLTLSALYDTDEASLPQRIIAFDQIVEVKLF